MKNVNLRPKIAYIKYGNVVQEAKKHFQSKQKDGDGAYLGRFLDVTNEFKVMVVSFSEFSSKFESENMSIKVLPCPILTSKKIKTHILQFFSTMFTLLHFQPDAIICGTNGTLLLAACIVSKFLKKKLIYSCHGLPSLKDNFLHALKNKIYARLLKQSISVLCNGPYLKAHLLNLGVPAKKIIMFLPTFQEFQKKSCMTDKPFNAPYFLFVGRIEESKGVFDILHALKELLISTKDIKLIYAGVGSDSIKLNKMIADLGLQDKAIMLGKIEYDNVAQLMRDSIAVVTPSKSYLGEGLNKTVVESFVVGKPVIAPNTGPFPYIITDGIDGLLYKPDSIDDLKQKISLIINNDHIYKRLLEGASISGQKFLKSKVNFSDAIKKSLYIALKSKENGK